MSDIVIRVTYPKANLTIERDVSNEMYAFYALEDVLQVLHRCGVASYKDISVDGVLSVEGKAAEILGEFLRGEKSTFEFENFKIEIFTRREYGR